MAHLMANYNAFVIQGSLGYIQNTQVRDLHTDEPPPSSFNSLNRNTNVTLRFTQGVGGTPS